MLTAIHAQMPLRMICVFPPALTDSTEYDFTKDTSS